MKQQKLNDNNWRRVEDELPIRGYNFLAYYKNQHPLIMILWIDVHGNYRLQGQSNTTGYGDYPKFSHWMPVPNPPRIKTYNIKKWE